MIRDTLRRIARKLLKAPQEPEPVQAVPDPVPEPEPPEEPTEAPEKDEPWPPAVTTSTRRHPPVSPGNAPAAGPTGSSPPNDAAAPLATTESHPCSGTPTGPCGRTGPSITEFAPYVVTCPRLRGRGRYLRLQRVDQLWRCLRRRRRSRVRKWYFVRSPRRNFISTAPSARST